MRYRYPISGSETPENCIFSFIKRISVLNNTVNPKLWAKNSFEYLYNRDPILLNLGYSVYDVNDNILQEEISRTVQITEM